MRTLESVLRTLPQSPPQHGRDGNVISIRVTGTRLTTALQAVAKRLSPSDQSDVWVVFEPDSPGTGIAGLFETGSLFRFMARRQSAWLVEMIKEGRLTSVYQPIVEAHSRRLFGYECLLRGLQGGRVIPATALLRIAAGAGLLYQLDLAARCSAIRGAATHDLQGRIFINFSPSAFDDEAANALRHTVKLLTDLDIPRERVVFEIIESERIVDLPVLGDILSDYRSLGFEVALDDVGAGYASLTVLQRLRPNYVKLDAQLIRRVHRDSYKAVLTAKLLEASRELGIRTVAEGVQCAGEREWLEAHGADLLQGFYFARPGSPPPTVLAA